MGHTLRERADAREMTAATAGFIVTPGDTESYMNEVNRQVESFNTDVNQRGYGFPDFVRQWTAFYNSWRGFYIDHTTGLLGGWTTRLTADAYDQTEKYQQELIRWRNEYARLGGQTTSPAPIVPTPKDEKGMTPLQKGLVFGGVAVAFGGIIAAVAYSRKD